MSGSRSCIGLENRYYTRVGNVCTETRQLAVLCRQLASTCVTAGQNVRRPQLQPFFRPSSVWPAGSLFKASIARSRAFRAVARLRDCSAKDCGSAPLRRSGATAIDFARAWKLCIRSEKSVHTLGSPASGTCRERTGCDSVVLCCDLIHCFSRRNSIYEHLTPRSFRSRLNCAG